MLIYPASLFARFDECAGNSAPQWGVMTWYTHAFTIFLQMFLQEQFGALAPKPVGFPGVEMGEAVSADGWRRTKATNVQNMSVEVLCVKQSTNRSLAKIMTRRRVTTPVLTYILLEAS